MKKLMIIVLVMSFMTSCEKEEENVLPAYGNNSVFNGGDHLYRWKDCRCMVRGASDWYYFPSYNVPSAKGCMKYSKHPCE